MSAESSSWSILLSNKLLKRQIHCFSSFCFKNLNQMRELRCHCSVSQIKWQRQRLKSMVFLFHWFSLRTVILSLHLFLSIPPWMVFLYVFFWQHCVSSGLRKKKSFSRLVQRREFSFFKSAVYFFSSYFYQDSGQVIPLIVESCIRFINLYGKHWNMLSYLTYWTFECIFPIKHLICFKNRDENCLKSRFISHHCLLSLLQVFSIREFLECLVPRWRWMILKIHLREVIAFLFIQAL